MKNIKEKIENRSAFTFNNLPITVIEKDGAPWFVAKEVCKVLEIAKHRDAISRLEDDEKSTCPIRLDGWSQAREVAVINESGIYSLIFTSNKPQAKAFRKWAHTELLPQIKQQKEVQMIDTKEKIENRNEFTFNNLPITVIEKDGAPWFIAKEVCDILEHSNHKVAVQSLDDDEKGVRKVYSLGGEQDTIIISESGLYTLIIRSNKPQAKAFRKWVTSVVLPTIRKTGSYSIQKPMSQDIELSEKDKLIKSQLLKEFSDLYRDKYDGRYSQILDSYAIKELTGEHVLPLPELPEKYYSAAEVGKLLGISANKVGRLANTHKLKNEQYGKWFADKSPYSTKEVQTFKYNSKFIETIELLNSTKGA